MNNEPVKLLRGAFIDSKGRKWDCNTAELENYFERKSGSSISSPSTMSTFSSFFTSKNIHYFCLKGNRIFYSLNDTSDPIGMVDLESTLNIHRPDENTLKLSSEENTNIDDILLYHESEDIISQWYDNLILKKMQRHPSIVGR